MQAQEEVDGSLVHRPPSPGSTALENVLDKVARSSALFMEVSDAAI
jgi:hypothetical protein